MNKNNLYAGKAGTENERFITKPAGTGSKTDETHADMNMGYFKEDQDMKIWNMTNRRMATGNNQR